MQLEIITPERKAYEGQVSGVLVPGELGQFEVLNGHAAIIATLVAGPVRVRSGKGVEHFKIDGGVIEVLGNKVTVLAEAIQE